MNEFIKYKLSDLYTMSSGISSKKEQAGHGTPFISFSVIFNNYFLPEKINDLMKVSDKELIVCSIKKGDIFLTRTSETLNELAMSCVALKDYNNTTFSGFAKRLRPKHKNLVYEKYMAFYLRSPHFRQIIKNNTIMTLRASFNENIFSFLEIYLPPYKTQIKIGDLLYSIERKIENNKKINDILELQAKLIYDYWFTQFDFPDKNGKPYRSSGGKMVWNEQLKRKIPQDWEVDSLLNVISWESNSQPPKNQFIYEAKKGYIRFIQNRDYASNNHITYIPITDKLSIASRYDILMDKYGNAGAVRYGIAGAFNVALGKISTKKENFQEYLRSYLESKSIYTYLHNSCMASTRASLNESNLSMLYIAIPKQNILQQYQTMLHSFRKHILQLKDENEYLEKLRDWLLPMLMNGQATIKQ